MCPLYQCIIKSIDHSTKETINRGLLKIPCFAYLRESMLTHRVRNYREMHLQCIVSGFDHVREETRVRLHVSNILKRKQTCYTQRTDLSYLI